MKNILILMMAVLAGHFSFAQAGESKQEATNNAVQKEHRGKLHHKKQHHQRKEMMKNLNLNEDQKKRLREMHEGNKEKKQAIINNSGLNEEQKKEQLKELRKEQGKNFQAVLTEEQKKQVKEMKIKMKEQRKSLKKKKTAPAESKDAAPVTPNQ